MIHKIQFSSKHSLYSLLFIIFIHNKFWNFEVHTFTIFQREKITSNITKYNIFQQCFKEFVTKTIRMLSCNISVLKISSRLRVTYKTKNRATLWTVQPTFPISQWKQKTERKEKVAQLSIFVSNFNYNGRLAFTNEDVRSCTSSTFFRDDQRAFQAQHVARTLLHREERGAPFGISVAKRPASSFVNRVARTGIWTRIPASHVATPTVIDKARSINETNSRRVTPTRI